MARRGGLAGAVRIVNTEELNRVQRRRSESIKIRKAARRAMRLPCSQAFKQTRPKNLEIGSRRSLLHSRWFASPAHIFPNG